jgi:hypothetical protein
MTKRLREAIEIIIHPDPYGACPSRVRELSEAYEAHRSILTVTMQRVEYLENCLVDGMNKRQAAKALVEHDPRIGRRTAETLVYTSFSGMYQNPRKRRRSSTEITTPVKQVAPLSISADEDLL